MFDVWSFVIGIIIGCSLGIAIVALLHGSRKYDDEQLDQVRREPWK